MYQFFRSRDIFRRNANGDLVFARKAQIHGASEAGMKARGTILTDEMLPKGISIEDVSSLRFKGRPYTDGSLTLMVVD